jgi:ABC-type transport system involved in cytochrome c biogenesis permease subunit
MMLDGFSILVAALIIFAAIWAVVLVGSRYFGPQ